MITSSHRIIQAAILAITCTTASAQSPRTPTRGELLYTTHCIECHTAQMHWRDKKLATDWQSLLAQVQRWQALAGLQWTEDDVVEVARYLNDTIYRHPQTSKRVGLAGPVQ
jgi:mono/diheme cytochrome c family protein